MQSHKQNRSQSQNIQEQVPTTSASIPPSPRQTITFKPPPIHEATNDACYGYGIQGWTKAYDRLIIKNHGALWFKPKKRKTTTLAPEDINNMVMADAEFSLMGTKKLLSLYSLPKFESDEYEGVSSHNDESEAILEGFLEKELEFKAFTE
uniref:Uncharacterized protein n=1 Tax=Oryza punctata TaxID=4537 RepID=A0A0E0LYU4_ORYPU